MIVAGPYVRQRNLFQAIRYTSKALVYRPVQIIHLLGLPIRVVQRHFLRKIALRDWTRCPIRVLHVTSEQNACYGIRELIDHCDSSIVEFIVVTLTGEGTFATELRTRGVTVYCLDCTRRLQYLTAVRAVLGIIRKHHVDIIHTHLVEPTWIGLTAARLMARGAIITRHHSDSLYRIENPIKRSAYHVLERCAGALADHIIAPSKCVLRILLNREAVPGAKVSVIPHGQDARRFLAVTAANIARVKSELGMEHRPTLVCVSRLCPNKGHVYLFEAFSVLQKEFPGLLLFLVGEGPDRALLESRAEKAGIGRSVRFLGWRDDVLDILAAADVVVQSSLAESFGLAVIEALALGRPVVCTDTADVREIFVPYAKIVPTADSDALAEALRSTLSNLEAANRLAARGKAYILESINASKTARRHVDVYQDVMARRHRLPV